MGFKHPELFISDPRSVQKPQQPPPPEVIKIQADAQTDKAKIESNEKQRAFDAQTQKTLAEIQAQTQIYIAQMNNAAKAELEQMRLQSEAQNKIFEAQQQVGIKQLDHQHETGMVERTTKEAAEEKADSAVTEREVKIIEHTAAAQAQTSQIVGAVGQQIVSVLSQFGNLIAGIQQTLAQQTMLQKAQLDHSMKPKVVSIGSVKKGDDGQITGATISGQ
jgi:hypothetical protein